MHAKTIMLIQNLEGTYRTADTSADGRVITDVDFLETFWTREDTIQEAGTCELGNKVPAFVWRKFLVSWATIRFSIRAPLRGVGFT
jgi:hypothetical protein